MEVILLEKIANLGNLGDKVSVKSGFARNYLLPQGKAKTATKENLAQFEARRAELEALEQKRLEAAQIRAEAFDGKTITIAHQAGEEGKLFGSVTTHEIAEHICKALGEVSKKEVHVPEGPIRNTGEYAIQIGIHGDVVANLTVKVEPIE